MGELIPLSGINLPSIGGDLQTAGVGGDFLKRIQLVSKGRYVDLGKIAAGHFGVPGQDDDITDLGNEIVVIPLAARDKAIDTTSDPVVINYDVNSDAFKRIQAAPSGGGCMWGPAFLVYEQTTGEFYEYFLSNKSGRTEATRLMAFLPISKEKAEARGLKPQGPQAVKIKAKYVKNAAKKWAWYAPEVSASSELFDSLPDVETIVEQITKFMSQESTVVEKVEETDSRRKR